MKSTNANKLLLLFISVLSLSSCKYRPETELLTGHWKYSSIENKDSSIIEINDNDIMTINADSTFEYHIESVNKHMYGKWTYTDHTLHLHYKAPDTIRHFPIDILSKHLLKMHENEVTFNFKKIKTD